MAKDFSSASDCLLIAFGGLAGGLHIPPFEFFNATRDFACKKLFVRDLQQCWYHRGTTPFQNNISSLRDELETLILESTATRIVAVGTSSGGYAALLFGLLLGMDEAHALSPKTYINPLVRVLTRDRVSKKQALKLLFTPGAEKKYFDLAKVLQSEKVATQLHLHYAKGFPPALKHSERLGHDPRVTLNAYDFDRHLLGKYLRDQGLLSPLLERIICGGETTAP